MAKESKIKTNLKEVREAYGMTQQDLADQVGIRRETIVHLENNRYNPSLEMALKIAQVFNKQVEELFLSEIREDKTTNDLCISFWKLVILWRGSGKREYFQRSFS